MDSTKILQEFGTKYRENLRRFYEYNDLLYKTKDFEAWADNLVSRSETIRTIFKENERIAGSIRLLLKEPLTEEIAEALFSATVMLKEAELRDPGLMIEIYEALIDSVNDLIEGIQMLIERTPPQLASDVFQDGVTLAGGASQLYGLSEAVSGALNIPCRVADEPRDCTVLGCARVLEEPAQFRKLLNS